MRAGVTVQKVEYKGWQNCYRVSNGEVELIVTGDVGPLSTVKPGKTVELVEHWRLFRNVRLKAVSNEELDRKILPLVDAVMTN